MNAVEDFELNKLKALSRIKKQLMYHVVRRAHISGFIDIRDCNRWFGITKANWLRGVKYGVLPKSNEFGQWNCEDIYKVIDDIYKKELT
jgi:hypothetical protein